MTNDRFMALYGQCAAPLIAAWSGSIGAGVLRGDITPAAATTMTEEAQQAFENAIAAIPDEGLDAIGWAPGDTIHVPVDVADFTVIGPEEIEVSDQDIRNLGLDPAAFPQRHQA